MQQASTPAVSYPPQGPPPQCPRTVYLRTRCIFIPNTSRSIQKNLFIQVLPEGSGLIAPLSRGNFKDIYMTNAVTAFRYQQANVSSISMKITNMTDYGEIEMSRLDIPLKWFHPNYVTHYYFPFLTKTPEKGQPMIEIDIHLSENGAPPFRAPPAQMMVMPMWNVPEFMIKGTNPRNVARQGYPAGSQHKTGTEKKGKDKIKKGDKTYNKLDDETELENIDNENNGGMIEPPKPYPAAYARGQPQQYQQQPNQQYQQQQAPQFQQPNQQTPQFQQPVSSQQPNQQYQQPISSQQIQQTGTYQQQEQLPLPPMNVQSDLNQTKSESDDELIPMAQ